MKNPADMVASTNTARRAAREFLQSVVVVDDRAALGGGDSTVHTSPMAASEATEAWTTPKPLARRSRRKIEDLQVPVSIEERVPEQALDAKVLVDGFAEIGLVCAVIRPDPSESPVERTVRAARRADIVILDWELNGDDGESAISIIRSLVHEDAEASPLGRLRLIAIYSGALALRQISSRVHSALTGEPWHVRFMRNGDFTTQAGSVRIVVFAKQTSRLDRSDTALRSRVVHGADLPERLVEEFAQMTAGLVPHVALASLAALRKNMHRVLGQLRADLDSAYLWHRATQPRPADAEEHLVDLIASELRSILEDERVGNWAALDAIREWIDSSGQSDFAIAFGEKSPRTVEDVLALLEKGAAGKGEANKDVRERFSKMCVEKSAHKQEIAGFSKSAESARQANEHFAALMSLRTRYEQPPPRLELGTILARGRGRTRTYWLCVQPRCDSVRLSGDTAFPHLPLKQVGDDAKFDVLLPSGRGSYRHYRLARKPADLCMPVFSVQPGGDAVVAERHGKNYVFVACNRTRYFWVADLKADYAQRIAQQLANEFSRVGLTESEWLRLWARKS